MEIEEAIEFLLEGQAKHEAEIKAIRKVISGRLKLVVKYQTRTNEKIEALLDAQLRTESKTGAASRGSDSDRTRNACHARFSQAP
jgi:hypothetical protein